MTIAQVKLWGKSIGAVSWDRSAGFAHFEYEADFIQSGIEVAPLTMPLSKQIYSFPALPRETFHGLPGLLADSLPDDFGNALINVWLASQGRSPESFDPVERLCYTGIRGMGALEYLPSQGSFTGKSEMLDVKALVELASKILTKRNTLQGSFVPELREDSLQDILRVGTSAGGARAKAIVAWNQKTNEVRSGQVKVEKGFSYWLLKFDGVSGNKDKELEDPAGYGLIEHAYYHMAKKAGIDMQDSRLLKENGRSHFMSRRFDRTETGQKIHMQSRMAFNIIGRNQDDHVKNIAFLMDKSGNWSLSPAFDMTYSYNPQGDWTSQHQMSLNSKRDDFAIDDFKACAKNVSMKRGRGEAIVHEVQTAVIQWKQFADKSGVPFDVADGISKTLRTDILK